jgi:hypothetical protein
MAVSLSSIAKHKISDQFKVNATLTFDSSYTTGGKSFNATDLGLAIIEDGMVTDSKGYTYDFTPAVGGTTATVKVYTSASGALAEVANATNLSTLAPKIVVYGK